MKVWCETCPKTLDLQDTNKDKMDEDAIILLMATASRHERLHPKHNLLVTIYEKNEA